MSGRDARRARQRKAERAARLREEAAATLQFIMGSFVRHQIEAERRLQSILAEFLPAAKDSPRAKYGGRYVAVDFGVESPFRHVIDEAAPFRMPANPDHHTWTRLPARWSAVDPARGPDQSRQLTVDMFTRADAFVRASDGAPPYEIISPQEYEQARAQAERNTNDAIRRRLFG